MNSQDVVNNVVTVYFSKDRPMQLDLALATNKLNSHEWYIQREAVLYSASTERFRTAYKQVSNINASVTFVEQSDFKDDLLRIIGDSQYVLFVVDDSIFINKYNLKAMVDMLNGEQRAIGFSLRLGKNTTYCYPLNIENEMPKLTPITGYGMSVFEWNSVGLGDFAYPLELSSSLYRTEDLAFLLENGKYDSPNSLEWLLSCNINLFTHLPKLFCYTTSRAFSNPINKVQTENNNRHGHNSEYDTSFLLRQFESGRRFDSKKMKKFVPNACHQEVDIPIV